jgi:flavin-dependent dehydrogenase
MARQLNPSQRYDVVVVGARCAGAATAMLLAAAGHHVALVDRSAFPSDTLSTRAIARRHFLDALLVEAAVSAGVRLLTGVTVDGVRRRFDGRVTGVRGRSDNREVDLATRFVVGADGCDSRIARSVGASFTEVSGDGVRHPVGPGWALVGGAGYHRGPITGHGISDAFRDAELLATALDLVLRDEADEADALADYHLARDAA